MIRTIHDALAAAVEAADDAEQLFDEPDADAVAEIREIESELHAERRAKTRAARRFRILPDEEFRDVQRRLADLESRLEGVA